MIRIAIFASGAGTNAENLIQYFANNENARIHIVFTNNPKAGVIERAQKLNIPYKIFSKANFEDPNDLLKQLKDEKIDFIVLAGFLLLIPSHIINHFKDRIINIHPALLPQHGGKGFYGNEVHKSVIASGACISGITIHHVNEKFDEGEIIFQAACHINQQDTQESVANKIHKLEYTWYPVVVEKLLMSQKN